MMWCAFKCMAASEFMMMLNEFKIKVICNIYIYVCVYLKNLYYPFKDMISADCFDENS